MTFAGMSLDAAWSTLSPPSVNELSSLPLDGVLARGPARVALDREGHRHLLVPAGEEQIPSDQRQSVLTVIQRNLRFGPVAESFVDVSCAEAGLAAEFDDLIMDVVESISESEEPARDTVLVIGRWRRMFSSAAGHQLSEEQRVGLAAELSVLKALHEANPSVGAALWTGPDRASHDFELSSRCLEVKAYGGTSDQIQIHGLGQLGTHEERPLFLLLIQVERGDDGLTLAELVDSVRREFEGDPALAAQLAKAGWRAGDSALADVRYQIGSPVVVPVESDVPRLVPSMLSAGAVPVGVSKVRYSVEISELIPHAAELTLELLADGGIE